MESKILNEATFPELPGAVWELSWRKKTTPDGSDGSRFELCLIIDIDGVENQLFETVAHSWQLPSVSLIEDAAEKLVERYHVLVLENILAEGPVRFR